MGSNKFGVFYRSIAKYFLQGLFYLVPISVTIYAISYSVILLDSFISLDVPGLGILVLFVAITIVGFLGTNYFIRLLKPFEKTIENTPLIKIIYTSMKDLMSAFVGKKKQFKRPVLVKMGEGIEMERLGFVTKKDLSDLNISGDKVAVYLPFSYAISGEVCIVPKKNVTPIEASSSDVMKMIISGGVTTVKQKDNNENNQDDEKVV